MNIDVKNIGCQYSITVPSGWDTIPQKYFDHIDNVDIALYQCNHNGYFENNYTLLYFLPSRKPLSTLSIDNIANEIILQNNAKDIGGDSMTVKVLHVLTKKDKLGHHIYTKSFVHRDTNEMLCLQNFVVTKLGFLCVQSYNKVISDNSIENSDSIVCSGLKIEEKYKYEEPTSKLNVSVGDVIISIVIGLFVYLILSLYDKQKIKK